MTRSPAAAAAACVTALVLASAAVPAHASYLGYGNGDPGNWDLWTEQNGGHNPDMTARAFYVAPYHHGYHARGERYVHHIRRPHDSFESKT
ncbi:MAG: hypothetical protein J0H65_05885 [Rhizobiales bacterium]|nr:hypothetical protein [Hyphomicrobiales bacterium]